jgi:hypothetical protein
MSQDIRGDHISGSTTDLNTPLDESERLRILAVEKGLRKARLRFIDRLELADELHRIARPIKVILHGDGKAGGQ